MTQWSGSESRPSSVFFLSVRGLIETKRRSFILRAAFRLFSSSRALRSLGAPGQTHSSQPRNHIHKSTHRSPVYLNTLCSGERGGGDACHTILTVEGMWQEDLHRRGFSM